MVGKKIRRAQKACEGSTPSARTTFSSKLSFARGEFEVTLVTSQVSKLLDRSRRSEEYAVNFFQRNRGSEYAVEFLVFGCPLSTKHKPS